VTVIAHAGNLAKGQTVAPLLYFRELKGSDRDDFIKNARAQIDQESAQIKSESKPSQKDLARLKDIAGLESRLGQLPADYPLYDEPKLVDGQIWNRILEDPENLKKLSIVSCMPDKVQALYPELKQLQDAGIQVEFAPISHFMETFVGKDHLVPNFHWIKREMKSAKAYESDRKFKSDAPAATVAVDAPADTPTAVPANP
jgi:hypothetical protein